MELKVKTFEELTTMDLYRILQLRAEIFVVEQNCVYQDLDGVDYNSLHIYLEQDGEIHGYLRAFEKAEEPGTVRLGRVLTKHHGKGLGGQLLREALPLVRQWFTPKRIYIEAQCYAVGYYEKAGFQTCTEEFMEDGIPHVGMELRI